MVDGKVLYVGFLDTNLVGVLISNKIGGCIIVIDVRLKIFGQILVIFFLEFIEIFVTSLRRTYQNELDDLINTIVEQRRTPKEEGGALYKQYKGEL